MPKQLSPVYRLSDLRFGGGHVLAYRSVLILTIITVTFFSPQKIFGEQLAVKNFSTLEGLSRNDVQVIYPDSRGFIWMGTSDGLSLFDGYEFKNYHIEQGLPNQSVNDILEDENGFYWIATGAGLCLVNFAAPLDADGKLQLRIFLSGKYVNDIYRDKNRVLWIGTIGGLFRLNKTKDDFVFEQVGLGFKEGETVYVRQITQDKYGNLWITTRSVLVRLKPDGKTRHFQFKLNDTDPGSFRKLFYDSQDRLWLSSVSGLRVLKPPAENEEIRAVRHRPGELMMPEVPGELAYFGKDDGLTFVQPVKYTSDRTFDFFESSDGLLWIATHGGITIFDGKEFRAFTMKNGLASNDVSCFAEDRWGNIWVGTDISGVMRIARNGFSTYTTADGLSYHRIASVFESGGELYVNPGVGSQFVCRFNGRGFDTVRPNFPKHLDQFGWSWNHSVLRDSRGEWWFPTGQGLVRFPAVARFEQLAEVAPLAVYDHKNGLPYEDVFRLYEDRRGDVWITTIAPPKSGLTRWEPSSGKFFSYNEKDRVPVSRAAISFAEDHFENLWIGFRSGKLARYRDGKFKLFEGLAGMPDSDIYDIFVERSGNLWLSTPTGAVLVENLNADEPKFTPFTTRQGLVTNLVIGITDDSRGRIYFATKKGLNRYEPETGQMILFTEADGLATSELRVPLRDRHGALWFPSLNGLTRFEPDKLKENHSPPPVFIVSLSIGGVNRPIGELGETKLNGIEIGPDQKNIEIEVLGLTQQSGDNLKYQYRLGSGDEWSEAGTQRKFILANLKSGDYEFQVRAINSNGMVGENTPTIFFTVLAPFYLRWWFITGGIVLVGGLIYLIYRYRLQKMLEVERIRLRIATDLHDDIGTSLSQISLISEVLANKQNGFDGDEKKSLQTIADASRGVVSSMSEMVWAINPKRDNLPDLIFRMRRFAGDTLTAAEIDFTFQAPEVSEDVRIDVDMRRQAFLIFKEAVNNAVKHSGCHRVDVVFSVSDRRIILSIRDDGLGFDEKSDPRGNGIENMRERAKNIGGRLKIISENGSGTRLILEFPQKSGLMSKIPT